MALVAACNLDHGVVPGDSGPPPDRPPDMSMPTWQIDATSKKAVPAAAFEWTQLFQANAITRPPPDHLWLMQDAAGPLEDSIGSIQLMPFAGPTYGNTVAGWTRHAIGTTDQVGTNQGWGSAGTGNLDAASSYLLLVYVAVIATPSGERSIMGLGANSDHRFVSITTAPVFKGNGTGVTPAIGTQNPMAVVHPVVMKMAPAETSYVVYTDQEKITVPWAPTMATGPLIVIGNATTVGPAPARYLYGSLWIGSGATATDADVKKLLQALGWTVTGY
jgi:hypothetical protein